MAFLRSAFLILLALILVFRFFNEASTEKLSHLSVIVHGFWLELVLVLERADEHFVWH